MTVRGLKTYQHSIYAPSRVTARSCGLAGSDFNETVSYSFSSSFRDYPVGADGTGRCFRGLRGESELGSDWERIVGRPRLGEALSPGCRSTGQPVSGAAPPRRLPAPRCADFAEALALARPPRARAPLPTCRTRTRPALSRSPPTQAAGSPPSPAVPSRSPPAGYRRHVIPPPSRPAPPPQPCSCSASRRRAPPTRASLTDDVAGAGTLGKAEVLLVLRAEVRGVGPPSERGKWGAWKTEGSQGKRGGGEKS